MDNKKSIFDKLHRFDLIMLNKGVAKNRSKNLLSGHLSKIIVK